MQPDLLNLNQKRRVTIVLRQYEEHLRMAMRWLGGYSEEGILYHSRLDLPATAQEEIKRIIYTAMDDLSLLSETLELENEYQNAATVIRGEISIDWVNLADIHARHLGGQGDVHPDLSGVIDPPLDRLANTALTIQAILGKYR